MVAYKRQGLLGSGAFDSDLRMRCVTSKEMMLIVFNNDSIRRILQPTQRLRTTRGTTASFSSYFYTEIGSPQGGFTALVTLRGVLNLS